MLLVCKHKFFNFFMNLKGEKPKRRRMRKNSNSNSKVLEYIRYSLENGKHKEVLAWKNKSERKFKLKFLHKNNPKWNEDMLSLFKATEEFISKKRFENYRKSAKHSETCKSRYRANLKKLCEAGALIWHGEKKLVDKSIEKIYEIANYADDPATSTSSDKEQFMCDYLLNDSEIKEILENICEMNPNTSEKKVEVESQVSIIVPVEIPSKEISHYLCLSNQVLHVGLLCTGKACLSGIHLLPETINLPVKLYSNYNSEFQ